MRKFVAFLVAVLLAGVAYGGLKIHGQLVDAAAENLSSDPTSFAGRFYFNTATNDFRFYDSTTWRSVGSGSGQKNYLASSTSTAAGWTASGAGITVGTDTTAADLPRPGTSKTGIKVTGVSGSSAFGYADFVLDPSDYNTKLQLQFAQACGLAGGATSTCASSDFKVDVYSCTIAWSSGTCGGTSTRLALSTDSSAISALPALTGTYRTTFDAPGSSAANIQVQIGLNATQTHALTVSDLVVGPGSQIQGAAITEWKTYTPTGTWSTNTTYSGYWRRVGDSMQINAIVSLSGAPTGAFTLNIPTGYTINTSFLSQNGFQTLGVASGVRTGTAFRVGSVSYSTTASVSIVSDANSATWSATNPVTWGNSDGISLDFVVPVNEWAGSGTVNVVQNDVIYYYSAGNTWGTTNSSATTSIGPGGVLGGTTTPAGTVFSYTFTPTYPIPVGAKPIIELSSDGIHWSPPGAFASGGTVENMRYDGTDFIGAGVYLNSSGQLVVQFGKYSCGVTQGWGAMATWYWRVAVGLPGQAVGFSSATSTQAGLVDINSQTFAGAKTWNDVQTFKASAGGTAAGSYNTLGAWTLGPSGSTATNTINGNLTLSQVLAATTTNDTSTGTVNALTLTSSVMKLTASTTITLNGIQAAAVEGSLLIIVNQTGNAMTVNDESGSASAVNQIVTSGLGAKSVAQGAGAWFVYVNSRWRMLVSG